MTFARNWREIRTEASAQGRLDPARADAARKEMHDAVQAERLADIRKAAPSSSRSSSPSSTRTPRPTSTST
jgi:hypothetical protein